MDTDCNIVLLGSTNAGKRTFIDVFNEIDPIPLPDKPSPIPKDDKPKYEGSFYFGRLTIKDKWIIRFLAIDNWNAFLENISFETLSKLNHCVLIFLDSTREDSLNEAEIILKKLRGFSQIPYPIIANKQDMGNAKSKDELYRILNLTSTDILFPCVAIEPNSARKTLKSILDVCANADFIAGVQDFFHTL